MKYMKVGLYYQSVGFSKQLDQAGTAPAPMPLSKVAQTDPEPGGDPEPETWFVV